MKVLQIIPQGSVLGPQLFTIYISDSNVGTNRNLFKFGVDTNDIPCEYICPVETSNMPSTWVYAFGFTLLPNAGGIFANRTIQKEITGWYATLKKPSWCPPNWMFGPVWTTLYAGMGYGSYLVWKELGGFTDKALIPLGLYGTQLILNWTWTPIFFGAHKMGLAFADILCIYGTAVATTVTWYPINRTAAYLMVPYIAWLTLASALNYRIWRDNKVKED